MPKNAPKPEKTANEAPVATRYPENWEALARSQPRGVSPNERRGATQPIDGAYFLFVVDEEIAMAKNRLSIPVVAVVRERNAVTSKPERTLQVDARAARAWRARCAAALLTCWAASGAHAGGPFSGSVSGSWSTPVLSGNLEDGATGALTPADNTTTAQCNLGCALSLPGYPATTLAWGTGASAPATSTLSFTGSPFTQQASNTEFTLGTFDYLNGISDTDSLIFGATLTLTLKDQSNRVIATQTIPLQITTTSNDGTSAPISCNFLRHSRHSMLTRP